MLFQMELNQHVKGAESQLPATAGVWGGSQQGPAMPGSFQDGWVHGAQPATSEVPVSQGREHCSCRQGLLTLVSLCSGAGRHLALGTVPQSAGGGRGDEPEAASSVYQLGRCHRSKTFTDRSRAAQSTWIRAGNLLPSLLGLHFHWEWHTAGPPTPDFTSCMKVFSIPCIF